MTNCIICNTESPKYKCPTCAERYCSVKCCTQHKKNTCERKILTNNKSEPAEKYKYETIDTVPLEKLALLNGNQELRNLLRNRHLQDFLKSIDSDENPGMAMEKGMQEPIFLEFAEACLKVIEPTPIDVSNDY